MSNVDSKKSEVLLRAMMELMAGAVPRVGCTREEILFSVEMLREALVNELLSSGLSPDDVDDVSTRARMHAQDFFKDGTVQ